MQVGGGLVDRLPVSTVYALNVIVPIEPLVALYIVQVVLVRSSGGGPTSILAEPLYALPVILVIVLRGGKSPNVLVQLGHNVVSIPYTT
jgi:hypothetical protein